MLDSLLRLMPDWSAVFADLRAHWYLYLSIPLVSALIGYVTKLVAVQMMFRPIEFIGIAPYFGWQGVIPRKAEKMAAVAVETVTRRLLSVSEIYERLDPALIAEELREPLLAAAEDSVHEVFQELAPGMWDKLPQMLRTQLIQRVQRDIPEAVERIMEELGRDIEQLLDIRTMVVRQLVQDKALLCDIFRRVGHEEFRFFGNSGFYFGFLIGLVQMTVWVFYKAHWVLPAFGLVVGLVSDWVALNLLFWPKQPRRLLGLKVQGLFLQRQQEVAADYGDLIARQLITPRHLLAEMLNGPSSARLIPLVEKHVRTLVDEQAGRMRPLMELTVGAPRYEALRQTVAQKVLQRMPETLLKLEAYTERAMDLRTTIVAKMRALSPQEFEGLLRPAFKEDEWILITIGALLGFLVGELQVFLMTQ